MPIKSKTTIKDTGYKRIMALIDGLKDAPVAKVGILESAGTHEGSDLTVAQVAVFNEFGTDRAPARPFMRYSALILNPIMKEMQKRLLDRMIKGDITIDMAISYIGEKAVAEIKNVITDWDTPPNAPSTIMQKARKSGREKINAAGEKGGSAAREAAMSGYDNPLIDTSQMRNSVTYVKVKRGAE